MRSHLTLLNKNPVIPIENHMIGSFEWGQKSSPCRYHSCSSWSLKSLSWPTESYLVWKWLLYELYFIQVYTIGNGQWTFFSSKFLSPFFHLQVHTLVMPLLLGSSLLWTFETYNDKWDTLQSSQTLGHVTRPTTQVHTKCAIWNRTKETCGKAYLTRK